MKRYKNLFRETELHGIKLKNKVFLSPMGTNMANADGTIGEQLIKFYEERAKGGVGVIITGAFCVDSPVGKGLPNEECIDDPKYIKGIKELSKAVHSYDSKLILQLLHAGAVTNKMITEGVQPVAQSPIPDVSGELCRALSTEEVKAVVEKFIQSAVYAKEANADGVSLHAAHGYLLNMFMSPATNFRDDEYGGSEENRSRIIVDIVKGIRAACGESFIIGTTFGAFDFCEGGYDLEEGKRIAQRLENAGLSYINLSYGVPGPVDPSRMIETQKYNDGNRLQYVEELKKAINLPVVLVGKLKDPQMCEDIISADKADFIALGRQAIADPEWVNKASEGRTDEIRKCLSCNDGCLKSLMSAVPIQCSINPLVGKEYIKVDSNKSNKSKKILVVGAGPAGVQAAITAANNGNEVTLVEKKDSIGGQLYIASIPPNKNIIREYITWSKGELNRKNVKLVLNTEVDIEDIKNTNPDAVIVATGSKPVETNISGVEYTINSWEALENANNLPNGKDISVVGGGIVGCETAHLLAKNNNRVTLFEIKNDVSLELEGLTRGDLLNELNTLGVVINTNTEVIEIKKDAVMFSVEEGTNQSIKADKVILSLGQASIQNNLAEDIQNELGIKATYIGDAFEVKDIKNAVQMGYKVGMDI